MSVVDPLPSWRPGPAKEAILGFVRSVTEPGDSFVPAPARVATWDDWATVSVVQIAKGWRGEDRRVGEALHASRQNVSKLLGSGAGI